MEAPIAFGERHEIRALDFHPRAFQIHTCLLIADATAQRGDGLRGHADGEKQHRDQDSAESGPRTNGRRGIRIHGVGATKPASPIVGGRRAAPIERRSGTRVAMRILFQFNCSAINSRTYSNQGPDTVPPYLVAASASEWTEVEN